MRVDVGRLIVELLLGVGHSRFAAVFRRFFAPCDRELVGLGRVQRLRRSCGPSLILSDEPQNRTRDERRTGKP